MPDKAEPTPAPKSARKSTSSTPPTADGNEKPAEDKADLRASFREALARKHAKNSHPEDHLNGHSVGTGNNDTHKRQFRRKSG